MIRTGPQFSGRDRFYQAPKSRREEFRRAQSDILPAIFSETSVDRKTNVAKVVRKGGLGGRALLGDLSNALKPSQNLESKKQNVSITDIERGASKNTLNATRKKSTSKASGKAPAGGHKPLSGKLNLNEGSNRSQNAKLKLSVVSEVPINVDAIPEEQFLYNQQECINTQSNVMDLNQFLQTLGLDNGSKMSTLLYFMDRSYVDSS